MRSKSKARISNAPVLVKLLRATAGVPAEAVGVVLHTWPDDQHFLVEFESPPCILNLERHEIARRLRLRSKP